MACEHSIALPILHGLNQESMRAQGKPSTLISPSNSNSLIEQSSLLLENGDKFYNVLVIFIAQYKYIRGTEVECSLLANIVRA